LFDRSLDTGRWVLDEKSRTKKEEPRIQYQVSRIQYQEVNAEKISLSHI